MENIHSHPKVLSEMLSDRIVRDLHWRTVDMIPAVDCRVSVKDGVFVIKVVFGSSFNDYYTYPSRTVQLTVDPVKSSALNTDNLEDTAIVLVDEYVRQKKLRSLR